MNYPCVKISGDRYRVYCEIYPTVYQNTMCAKSAVKIMLNKTEDYFIAPDDGGMSDFEIDGGKIEVYRSTNMEV